MSGQHRAHFRSHPVDLQHCWQDLLQRAFHHRSVEATTFSHALHYMCNLTSFADAMKLGFLCFVVLLQLLAQERTGTMRLLHLYTFFHTNPHTLSSCHITAVGNAPSADRHGDSCHACHFQRSFKSLRVHL